MNELVTPRGYAEYPRDRKFRPRRDSDRLADMAKGYSNLRWVLIVCAFPLQNSPQIPSAGDILAAWALLVVQFLILRAGLSKIFGGRGWPEWLAAVVAVLPEAAAIIHMERLFPGLTLLIYGVILVSIALTAHFVVFGEFAKSGLKVKRFGGMGDQVLLDAVHSVRLKEIKAASQPVEAG